MDEDALLERLRGLGRGEVPVAVDRAGVLRAGRRRRVARTAGTAAAVLALVVGVYPSVAALRADGPPVRPAAPTTTTTASPAPRALVDREAGTITLPVDAVRRPVEEQTVMDTAQAHFRSTCMAGRGYADLWPFTGPVVPAPQPSRSTPYGVWRESDVRATGYGHAASARGGRDLPDDEAGAVRECEAEMAAAGLAVPDRVFWALVEEHDAGGWTDALSTDEGRALRAEWARCLTDAGAPAPPPEESDAPAMIPEGVLDAPLEEQVRVGLIDVACKDRLDLVQRLADIDAAQEAGYLERTQGYRAELDRLEDAVLAQARRYLTEHGITVP